MPSQVREGDGKGDDGGGRCGTGSDGMRRAVSPTPSHHTPNQQSTHTIPHPIQIQITAVALRGGQAAAALLQQLQHRQRRRLRALRLIGDLNNTLFGTEEDQLLASALLSHVPIAPPSPPRSGEAQEAAEEDGAGSLSALDLERLAIPVPEAFAALLDLLQRLGPCLHTASPPSPSAAAAADGDGEQGEGGDAPTTAAAAATDATVINNCALRSLFLPGPGPTDVNMDRLGRVLRCVYKHKMHACMRCLHR